MIRTISALCLAAFLCLMSTTAQAQVREKYGRSYQPSRPTLSPYLNFFRSDTGVMDNYNTFVRPRQQLQDELNQQNYRLRTLNRDINQLEQQQATQTIRPSTIAPTGVGSTFMNYSHYYNLGRNARRR